MIVDLGLFVIVFHTTLCVSVEIARLTARGPALVRFEPFLAMRMSQALFHRCHKHNSTSQTGSCASTGGL